MFVSSKSANEGKWGTNVELLFTLVVTTTFSSRAIALPKVRHREEIAPWDQACVASSQVLHGNPLLRINSEELDVVSGLRLLIAGTGICDALDDQGCAFLLAFEGRGV
jgi:hypothetical protein